MREKEKEIVIFSCSIKEEFQNKSEIKGLLKPINIKNPRIGSIIGRIKWKKRSVWPTLVGRKREEDILISQAIRILNPSWYGVSYMHLKGSLPYYFMVKLYDFSL